VRAALATGEALQLAVRAPTPPTTDVPSELLPSSLASIVVHSGVAADYDAFLGGAS